MTIRFIFMWRFAISSTLLLSIICRADATPQTAKSYARYEAPTNYLDGVDAERCQPPMRRHIAGLSGHLLSQPSLGSSELQRSKDCFIVIRVPVNYQVRVKAVYFNVPVLTRRNTQVISTSHQTEDLLEDNVCADDSLHFFDYAVPAADSTWEVDEAGVAPTKRGIEAPPLGTFCGRLPNDTELVVSTTSGLTVWWHTGAESSSSASSKNGHTAGFQLLWTAVRRPTTADPCRSSSEFACRDGSSCIPLDLSCDDNEDCTDESDRLTASTAATCNAAGSRHSDGAWNLAVDGGGQIQVMILTAVLVFLLVFIVVCCVLIVKKACCEGSAAAAAAASRRQASDSSSDGMIEKHAESSSGGSLAPLRPPLVAQRQVHFGKACYLNTPPPPRFYPPDPPAPSIYAPPLAAEDYELQPELLLGGTPFSPTVSDMYGLTAEDRRFTPRQPPSRRLAF